MRKGPLTIEVPRGWEITRSDESSMQMADGSAGDADATTPGTAKAVFDVYLETTHTPDSYERLLQGGHASYERDDDRIGGNDAVVFEYRGAEFAGRQIAVLFPRYRVLIVYRAAYPNDDDAYRRGLSAFREALRSIRFAKLVA